MLCMSIFLFTVHYQELPHELKNSKKGLITVKTMIINALTVCYRHVTYVFQSESTLYSCLIVKELLARSRSSLTFKQLDRNYLVRKRALNQASLAKSLSIILAIQIHLKNILKV